MHMPIASLNSQVQAILHEAILARVFPGAVVAISQNMGMLCFQVSGTTAYDDHGSQPVTRDTIYDIASLTKVITATAALRLIEQNILDMHAAVRFYLPELAMRDVTIWHLLTHSSGLDLRLSSLAYRGVDVLKQSIAEVQPVHRPGSVAAYTNINSLLLGEVVARVYAASLEQALAELVLQPLDMHTTQYCPPARLHSRIAPTEIDETLHRGSVQGVVHDESAYVLGGVAGHAGLFSTAADLLTFCHAWLGLEAYQEFLQPATRQLAFQNHCPGLSLSCGLGWMLERPAFMGPASQYAIGHTGFTGPVIVLLPKSLIAIIVLSNRTYPRRAAPTHHTVTSRLIQALMCMYTDNQNMI